jgi:hypothetical protein
LDDYSGVAYLAGGGGLAWLGQQAWQRFFTKEGKANDALVEQLSQRISAQELRLQSLESGLDQERDARRKAEDKVHALELDNMLLRAELSRHGIDVPPAKYA